jgi:hypothetical protein
VSYDSNTGACDVIRSGSIGTSPWLVGDHSDSNNAWVCVGLGSVQERVMLSATSGSLPFQQDDPSAVSPPVRVPWTPGVASADCDSRSGVNRLLNLGVGGGRVWLDAWQSGSVAELCVRGQDGSAASGLRIGIDATGFPGVTPVIAPVSSMAPCNGATPIFTDTQDHITIEATNPGTLPAAICVEVGSSVTGSLQQLSVTANVTGSLKPITPTVTQDS